MTESKMNQEEIDEFREEMKNGEALGTAKDFYRKVLIELAVREDNKHVGSGLGGDPLQLFFLLSHRVKVVLSSDEQCHFERVGANEVLLQVSANPSVKQARLALTAFINAHPDKKTILTKEEILNPSALRDLKNRTENISILAKALEEAQALVPWLDMKIELSDKISTVFHKEEQVVEQAFCKEMKLPLDHFEKDIKDDPYQSILRKHPVWGAQLLVINSRQSEMHKQLLSQADRDRLIFIGSCPSYITMFVFRSIIGLERTVALCLDEEKSCDFLNKINRTLND